MDTERSENISSRIFNNDVSTFVPQLVLVA